MVSTKHCSWGECKTDSRYREKWPKSLKEVEKSGRNVFIPFPKPSQDIEKCRRWIVACSRQFFTENNITRNTYKHMCPSLASRKGTDRRFSRSTESESFSSTSEPRVGEKESACIESEASNSRKARKNSGWTRLRRGTERF